jgi:hypothetical protein
MKKNLLFLFAIFSIYVKGQNCIPNTSSLSFDGVSSYIDIPFDSSLNISDVITIEAWINSNQWGFSSAQNSIACKHGWTFGEEGYVLRAGGTGELSFNIAGVSTDTTWQEVISTTNAIQLNTWTHVAGIFDGSELKIYINGNLAGTTPFIGTINPSVDYNLNIGRLADEQQFETRYWSGLIDEVRIWHRALSQSEIMSNMNKHIDPTTAVDLVAYWRMNDLSGGMVEDLGPHLLNGTVYSTSWSSDVPFSDGPPVPTITPGGPFLYSSSATNNQWNLDGSAIPGATGLSIVPNQNGSYTVTVTDSAGCSVTSAPFIETTLSVGNISGESPVQIIAADGILHLTASAGILKTAEVNVFDVSGKLLVEKPVGTSENELILNGLACGVYIVTVRIDSGFYRLKFVL